MSGGVFPASFLSSPGSSFSIQRHVHLSPIVLPVEGCVGVVSIFLDPLLQLTVIVKFFLQRKTQISYSYVNVLGSLGLEPAVDPQFGDLCAVDICRQGVYLITQIQQ